MEGNNAQDHSIARGRENCCNCLLILYKGTTVSWSILNLWVPMLS